MKQALLFLAVVLFLASPFAAHAKIKGKVTIFHAGSLSVPMMEMEKAFVGMSNLFAGAFSGGRAYLEGDEVAVNLTVSPAETATLVAIRPEEIVPLVPGTNGLANTMTGRVADIACQGFFFDVAVMVGDVKFTARWNRNQIREFGVKAGKEIGIGFHAGSVHVF